MREAWPAGCDNGALQEPLRQALLKWRLTPTLVNRAPVQVEALMGFTFHTQLDSAKSVPILTNEEARSLASSIVEPTFPPSSGPHGSEFIAQISVDQTGKYTGILNTHHLTGNIFLAIDAAVRKWEFQPYVKDGKPQYFHADVSFRVN